MALFWTGPVSHGSLATDLNVQILSSCGKVSWWDTDSLAWKVILTDDGGSPCGFFQGVPSPFLVFSTTRLTITGIRQMGVITRAKTICGGGSLNSSMEHSWKNFEWMLTKISSTSELGHGIRRQSDASSVYWLSLLYKLQTRRAWGNVKLRNIS